jgi:hypothetical protein
VTFQRGSASGQDSRCDLVHHVPFSRSGGAAASRFCTPVKESVRKGVGQQNLKPDWYVAHRAATPIMKSFIVLTAQGTLCRQV